MMYLPWIVAGGCLAVLVLIAIMLLRRQDRSDPSLILLQEQVSNLQKELREQHQAFNETFTTHLRDNLKVMQDSQQQVGSRLDNAARVIGEVQGRLGKLEEANQRIFEVGKDIASLQEILKAPKLRGGLGELFLGDLLSQVMPAEHYETQYRFKSGEAVDAVVRLSDYLVPIDAKFPLENFQKLVASDVEAEKKTARRLFISDVKKHIDAIASKYIRPDEQTFDFALMYIPAENVYYETIIKDDEFGGEKSLFHYAMHRRVIPVSPNNFYVYLNTILLGLRGFKIEKSIHEVIANLARLKGDFDRFDKEFRKIGTHLNHARSSYESADKSLSRFNDKLTSLEAPTDAKQPALQEALS